MNKHPARAIPFDKARALKASRAEAVRFTSGTVELFNPSVIELPRAWRQFGKSVTMVERPIMQKGSLGF